jgi:hypothetical protein
MHSAWVNFVYTGNPNDGPLHGNVIRPFPLYNSTARPLVQLDYPDDPSYTVTNLKQGVCSQLWNNVYATTQSGAK